MGYQSLALFAQQFDKAGFLFNQRVNAAGFAVESTYDGSLLFEAWPYPRHAGDIRRCNTLVTSSRRLTTS